MLLSGLKASKTPIKPSKAMSSGRQGLGPGGVYSRTGEGTPSQVWSTLGACLKAKLNQMQAPCGVVISDAAMRTYQYSRATADSSRCRHMKIFGLLDSTHSLHALPYSVVRVGRVTGRGWRIGLIVCVCGRGGCGYSR